MPQLRWPALFLLGWVALSFPPAAAAGMINGALPASISLWNGTYGAKEFSSICVACHTENPSIHIVNAALPFGENENLYRGSHFTRNMLDGRNNLTGNKSYEYLGVWTASNAYSKYGNIGNGRSVVGNQGELICESCHNIMKGIGNSKLLANYSESTGDSSLCAGCHQTQAIGNGSHHPQSGHDVGPDGNDTGLHVLATDHYSHLRNPIANAINSYGVRFFSSPNELSCASCHKPHRAMTATGARILRRGLYDSPVPAVANKSVNVVIANGVPDSGVPIGNVILRAPAAANSVTGLHRQSDMDSGKRLATNVDPLCEACH